MCVLGTGEKSTNSDMSTDGGITTGCDPGMWLKLAGMPPTKTQIYSQGGNKYIHMDKNKYIQVEKRQIYSHGVAVRDRRRYSNAHIVAHSYV